MKKILLSLLIGSSFAATAQSLVTENFNGLTIGNVSTETAGTVAGQGGYFLFSNNGAVPTTSTNSAVTNTQIVAGGNASQGLEITGPNGDKGSRFMWKNGLPTIWAARTLGNNIIEVEVDINPGAGTTLSRNTFGIYIYNAAGDRILAGFFVRASTRELFLLAYSTPTGQPVGNYNYALAAAPGIQLPANVFSRVGISYNKTTGQVLLKAPGVAPAGAAVAGSSAGVDPDEIDFISGSGNATATPNTTFATMVMDNMVARASSTDTLLGTDSFTTASSFSVYPNPVRDLVTLEGSNDSNIQSYQIADLNGRIVKSGNTVNTNSTQVNMSDLQSGVYMMTINSDKGSTVKKIIKE